MSESSWAEFCRTVVSRIEAIRRVEGYDGRADVVLQPDPNPHHCRECRRAFDPIKRGQRFCDAPCAGAYTCRRNAERRRAS